MGDVLTGAAGPRAVVDGGDEAGDRTPDTDDGERTPDSDDGGRTASDLPALVMCGGRGTRLGGETEKPLVEVGGVPMVDRVIAALRDSAAGRVHAVVSPHAPDTRAHLDGRRVAVVDAPGEGYVPDLEYALDRVGTPAVTVAADLALLAADPVDRVVDVASVEAKSADVDGDRAVCRRATVTSVAVCVPAALKRRLGASVDSTFERDGRELAPAGVNVVADDADTTHVSYDARLAVNVNRPADLDLAEALCE